LPQSIRLLVSRALATAIAGPPRLDAFGLTVVRLTVGTVGPLPLASPGLVYRELVPPDPTRVAVTNHARFTGAAQFGQLLVGGMADRVVTVSTPLRPGETVVVPVAAVSPRWWDQGRARLAGQLQPAPLALLLLATSDRPGLRSIARTTLWEAYRHPTGRRAEGSGDGWALFYGSTLLAIHLTGPLAEATPRDTPPSDATSLRMIRQALAEAPGADHVAHAVQLDGNLLEVSVVRASMELPETVLRAGRATA
jgi:hypothetical protein